MVGGQNNPLFVENKNKWHRHEVVGVIILNSNMVTYKTRTNNPHTVEYPSSLIMRSSTFIHCCLSLRLSSHLSIAFVHISNSYLETSCHNIAQPSSSTWLIPLERECLDSTKIRCSVLVSRQGLNHGISRIVTSAVLIRGSMESNPGLLSIGAAEEAVVTGSVASVGT